jgi:hypothetical protein
MSVRTFILLSIAVIILILLAIWKVPIWLIGLGNWMFGWNIPVTLKTWFLTWVCGVAISCPVPLVLASGKFCLLSSRKK